MAHARIQVGDQDVTVVDNEQWDEHRAGYNGIARLTSKHFRHLSLSRRLRAST